MARNIIKQKEKLLLKKIGPAIRDYNMIQKGDRICIAVSGGRDSLSTLKILSSKTLRIALQYSIQALHIETDYRCKNCTHKETIEDICKGLDVACHFGKADVVKNNKKETVNCFWCSWNKRKSIFKIAEKLNCNKIAFGHHKDDVIETTLLNLFYNGEIATMNPKQVLFGGKLTIIRPLCYVEKKEIVAFAKVLNFPSTLCACPYGDLSKRKFMRGIIEQVTKTSRVVKTNIFRAPSRIREEYLGKTSA